jgi:DNA-binding cell septation regulator SpoVG
MYAFEFKPKTQGIDHGLIFVAMPFEAKYDSIYNDLIVPAIKSANKKMDNKGASVLKPFRTKDDIRTTSGWINVLEHLYHMLRNK